MAICGLASPCLDTGMSHVDCRCAKYTSFQHRKKLEWLIKMAVPKCMGLESHSPQLCKIYLYIDIYMHIILHIYTYIDIDIDIGDWFIIVDPTRGY